MMTTVSLLAMVFVLCIIFVPETLVTVFGYSLPLNMCFMVLCGLCTSVMWGAIFNLSTEGLGKYTPLASGIYMTLVCGGGIMPFIQNLIADSVGTTSSYWFVFAALIYMLFFALIGSKNVNKNIPVE